MAPALRMTRSIKEKLPFFPLSFYGAAMGLRENIVRDGLAVYWF